MTQPRTIQLAEWVCSNQHPVEFTPLSPMELFTGQSSRSVFVCGCGGTVVRLDAGKLDIDKLIYENRGLPGAWRVHGARVALPTYDLF